MTCVTWCICLIAPAASGAQDSDALTIAVSAKDLDLASAKDRKRLDTRIRAASRMVCAPLATGLLTSAEQECRRVAMKSASPQVAFLTDRSRALAQAGQPSEVAGTVTIVGSDH